MNEKIISTDKLARLVRKNIRMARHWKGNNFGVLEIEGLRELTLKFGFSLSLGDLTYLGGGWYVTHAGLVRLASRKRCVGIEVQQVPESCDQSTGRWVFKATVYKSSGSRGFVGYGDADPSNVSTLVHGAEMRIAETRAVNRALRKAYGIGLCSVEELGSLSRDSGVLRNHEPLAEAHQRNGTINAQPRLRDQLCLLIRQYNLDPTLVKAYAADFCGTQSLKEARRELIESFINHVAASAKENRDALLAKLNSYAQPQEAKP